jgi:DNA polymerase elongation subunit (family B)
MYKNNISSRGTGEIDKNGKNYDYKVISLDFATLYPNTMKSYNILPDNYEKILLRKERLEKLEQIENIIDGR